MRKLIHNYNTLIYFIYIADIFNIRFIRKLFLNNIFIKNVLCFYNIYLYIYKINTIYILIILLR